MSMVCSSFAKVKFAKYRLHIYDFPSTFRLHSIYADPLPSNLMSKRKKGSSFSLNSNMQEIHLHLSS
uniref:Uncharacterized protein n=1 Tax=Globisporangium ultimum (strain ATCC 200006 / CBS 805.95 / DAOM BR144) TaxID=431595 RepID=K3WCL0_GLOUD